jgi:phosphotransferase system enzyme I (PtsI)
MNQLAGISAAPGIAIGPAFVFAPEEPSVPRYDISKSEVETEMSRFQEAATQAHSELQALRDSRTGKGDEDQVAIIDSHMLMVRDPDFVEQVRSELVDTLMNVEWVLYQSVQRLLDKLGNSSDQRLRERSSDLKDVSGRVLNHLLQHDRFNLSDLDHEVVLVAPDLMPSDVVSMNKRMVRAIAMDAGGRTSHTAILARSFEIPSVLGLSNISRHISDGDTLIVDGYRGIVIVDPDETTLARYEDESQDRHRHEVHLMRLNDLPAETRDGKLIALKANIEVPDEVEAVLAHGADGVGLYRSEFLFLGSSHIPSEEEQYHAYSSVLRALPDKPVTIRTLDIGGDKVSPFFTSMDEKNPILGWRAIRFCLGNREVFRAQLRALLRSSVHGELQLMFPMISGLEELQEAIRFVEEVSEELRSEGVEVAADVPVGTMIEVPAAAMVADILARKSSFFSVGTNDLIQYTIAVDRGNERIAYLYEPYHPGVLRLLRLVADSAHENGIPVAMCGEMAADPLSTVLLLGLGYDELSMSAGSIPEIKEIIRSVSIREAEEVVGEAMELRSFREVDRFLRQCMEERFGVTTN